MAGRVWGLFLPKGLSVTEGTQYPEEVLGVRVSSPWGGKKSDAGHFCVLFFECRPAVCRGIQQSPRGVCKFVFCDRIG